MNPEIVKFISLSGLTAGTLLSNTPPSGPVAQLVEQLTFNQWVTGSNPVGLTTVFNNLAGIRRAFWFSSARHRARQNLVKLRYLALMGTTRCTAWKNLFGMHAFCLGHAWIYFGNCRISGNRFVLGALTQTRARGPCVLCLCIAQLTRQ